MNKKLLSLVLAAVFTVSLGTSSWAYDHAGSTTGGVKIKMSSVYNQYGTGNQSSNKDMNDDDFVAEGAKSATNSICAVFNYASGIVLSAMDADRNLTIYSAGAAFLSMSYNEATGNKGFGYFTITGVTISGSDWENVEAAGGLEAFCKKLGVSDSMLTHAAQKKDADGNIIVDKDGDTQKVGWLSTAESTLAKGVNHSISINFTATGGASVTLMTNGKQMDTLGYDYGQTDYTPIAIYNYNAAGMLESISQKTYKTDDNNVGHSDAGSGNNDEKVDDVTYYVTFTEVHMDEYGRQSFATDTNGNIVTTYSYSSTGSIASIHDLTTNSTTWYEAGKTGFVLNDSGFMTTKYFYHENGSLDYVGSYNFDEDANNGAGKVSMTQASAYRYGKFIGSADLTNLQSGQPRNGDEIRAAVDYMKTNPDKWKQSLKDGAANIDSTYKASDGNTYYWNGSGWIDKDGKQVTDDISAAISNAKKEFEEDKGNKDKKWEDQDASKKENYSKVTKGVYKELTEKGKELATAAVTNTSPFANITTIGIYANDLNNTAFINTYKSTFCETQAKKNEFDKAISDMVKFSNGSSMLGQVSLTIDAVSFETESQKGQNTTTTATTNESNTTSAFAGTRTKSTKPATKTDDVVSNVTQVGKVGQQISAKLTVMDHGVQCYQLQLDGFTLRASQNQIITTHDVYEATLVTETDPVVEGQLWQPQNEQDLMNKAKELGVIPENYATQEEYEAALEDLRNGFYTNADGQSYALVEAASINIMDGKGFHAANGETFLVEVDNATKENITNNIKNSGDRSIMFMGDVRESAAGGYPTIAMNTSYGGGVVQGAAAIETAKAEITQKSQAVAQAREALESGDISQSEYDSIVESAGWVGNNTEENLEKFAKGNYSWDENKTAAENIRDFYDIMLNF